MKSKLLTITTILATSVIFAGCKNKSRDNEEKVYLRPATMDYTGKDTTEIMNLVNEYVSAFKEGNYNAAANMLYNYSQNNVTPYTEAQKDSFLTGISMIPVYDCEITGLTLRSDKNNSVDVTIQLIPDGSIEDGVGISHMYINPVYVDGHWYLTTLDIDAEGVEDIYKTDE